METELIEVLSDLTNHNFENEQLGNQVLEKAKELDKVARSLREVAVNWESMKKSVSEERGNPDSNDLTSEDIILKEEELLKMALIKRSLKEIAEELKQTTLKINCQISELTSSTYLTCHDEGLIILALEQFGYNGIVTANELLCQTREFLANIDFCPTSIQQDLLSSKYLPKLLLVVSEKIEETTRDTRQAAYVFQLTGKETQKLKEKLRRSATKNKIQSKM